MLFDRKINKSLLREMIANGDLDEIERAGRVYLPSGPLDYLNMYELANHSYDLEMNDLVI